MPWVPSPRPSRPSWNRGRKCYYSTVHIVRVSLDHNIHLERSDLPCPTGRFYTNLCLFGCGQSDVRWWLSGLLLLSPSLLPCENPTRGFSLMLWSTSCCRIVSVWCEGCYGKGVLWYGTIPPYSTAHPWDGKTTDAGCGCGSAGETGVSCLELV